LVFGDCHEHFGQTIEEGAGEQKPSSGRAWS
jgi:hypothetical protein